MLLTAEPSLQPFLSLLPPDLHRQAAALSPSSIYTRERSTNQTDRQRKWKAERKKRETRKENKFEERKKEEEKLLRTEIT